MVAFPPPPVTFPANEAHVPKDLSGVTPDLADHFQEGVVRFYPNNSGKLESKPA
ncbi:MAG: hypothetical protein ACKVRN_10730 [Pyrinomonadaceae bacterium]